MRKTTFNITVLLGSLLISSNAMSATIVVNTDTSGSGCTIMDAIDSANADSALGGCLLTTTGTFGDDTIVIPEAEAIQTLFAVNNTAGALGDNGLPQITSKMTIEGNNALIQRSSSPSAPDFRIFYVGTSGDLTLENVRIVNGKESNGAALYVYGGKATLRDVVISNNTATSTNVSGFADGYAVASFAVGEFDTSLQLFRSRIVNNAGGGINSTRSGVTSGNQQLFVQDSVISENAVAGVSIVSGTASINRSEISFNQGSGVLTGNNVILRMRDSTISNNKSSNPSSSGGGIAISIGSGDPMTTLINNTITENEAGSSGGIRHRLGTLNLINNIIAGNTTINPAATGKEINRGPGFSGGSPVAGNQRNNVIGSSDNTTAQALTGFATDASDLIATSDGAVPTPLRRIVSGLKNNGGFSRTHALIDGSPAVDAAVFQYSTGGFFFAEGCAFTSFFPTMSTVIRNDQRGIERPIGAACDIGAIEQEPSTFYVIPLPSGGTIVFDL